MHGVDVPKFLKYFTPVCSTTEENFILMNERNLKNMGRTILHARITIIGSEIHDIAMFFSLN